MNELLHTLPHACQHGVEIRKSRFVAQAAPVDGAAQALAFLQSIRDPSASHHCWAYRVGAEYRFNDDGEPGGTAGRPILQAIESQGIDRVMVVVCRWFGGIKLGAGGLARAYGGTAAECLRLAERVPIVAMARLRLHCAFAELALLKARLGECLAEIDSETFDTEGVTLILCLPLDQVEHAQARVIAITRGRRQAVLLD
ncbi:MAG: IMPACT family protein [Rhodanobacter sp.]